MLGDQLSNDIPEKKVKIIDIDLIRDELFQGPFLPENESFVRESALLQTREL